MNVIDDRFIVKKEDTPGNGVYGSVKDNAALLTHIPQITAWIEKLNKAIWKEIGEIHLRISQNAEDINENRAEITGLQNQLNDLKNRVKALERS